MMTLGKLDETARSLNRRGAASMLDLYDEFGGELDALRAAGRVMDGLDAEDRLILEKAMRVCSRLGGDMSCHDLERMLVLGRCALRRAAAMEPAA